ncbi:MAG: ABC-F family ATP-binding cassette domain-containing protein, partial [Lachnospiraceae bacterium]|nr:ABC-F family ATP-binding cassette domain-containing protein [Lachnospiraceae bacterium]
MRYQIRHALVQYGADTIIEDVNFEIRDREKIAVVGRNGCGKTTLLKLISGEIEMSNLDSDEKSGIFMQGKQRIGLQKQISFPDGSISARDEICKVFADLYAVQARMNEIETLLAAGKEEDDVRQRLLNEYASLQRRYDALSGDSSEREMEIMFQKFGFALEELDRPIGSFSGGQQTKIAFIKLLLSYPDILLLDEPTNHLDLPSIEWLEDYLKKYKNAVVIVSHDRAFLDRIVDVTYEIEYHRMKRYAGNYSAFVKQKEEALAKQEKDYEAQQAEIKRLSEWIEKWKNTPTKVSATRSKRKV